MKEKMNGNGKNKDCCGCEAPKSKKEKAPKCEECKPPKEKKHHKKKKEECCDCGCGDHYITPYHGDHGYPIQPAPQGHLTPGLPSAYPGMAAPSAGPAPEQIGKPKDTGKDTGKGGEGGEPMPPKKTSAMPPAVELAPATTNVSETETQHPFELSRRYEVRVERATDYSRITGQLFFVHADGGLWVLRYAPLGQEDPYGGGVILARNRQMDGYRDGDLVTIRGEILNEKASAKMGAPLYRAQSIELIERGQ